MNPSILAMRVIPPCCTLHSSIIVCAWSLSFLESFALMLLLRINRGFSTTLFSNKIRTSPFWPSIKIWQTLMNLVPVRWIKWIKAATKSVLAATKLKRVRCKSRIHHKNFRTCQILKSHLIQWTEDLTPLSLKFLVEEDDQNWTKVKILVLC
jgi:hypothetical protein